MMDKRYSLPLILLIPGLILQISVVQFISVQSIAPNFLILALVFCTLNFGQVYGSVLGFLFGAVYDLLSGAPIGISMFSFTIAGFLAGYFFDPNKITERTFGISFSGIVFSAALAASFISTLLESSMAETQITVLFFEHSIPSAVYSAAFAFVVLLFRKETKVG